MNIFTSQTRVWLLRVVVFFVSLAVLGGILYITGFYPLVSVNGSWVWAYVQRSSYNLTINFYHTLEIRNHMQSPQDSELLKIVYDGLIDDVLIRDELRTMLSSAELQKKIAARVQEMIQDPQAHQQVLSLTQVSEHNTVRYFLEPLARQQLLGELLLLKKNQDITSWLLSARTQARVSSLCARGVWSVQKGYLLDNK